MRTAGETKRKSLNRNGWGSFVLVELKFEQRSNGSYIAYESSWPTENQLAAERTQG